MINLFSTTIYSRHNKNTTSKLVSGFSIIEIIIYLAIFTTMSIVVINSFIIILSSFSAIRTNHDLLDSGSMSMERVTREIRQAKNIDIANSTSEILQLNSTDNSSNDIIIKIMKEDSLLNIYEDGVLVGNLLASSIILNSISFEHIINTNSEAVKIKMILEDTKSKSGRAETFYNTVVLRGAY